MDFKCQLTASSNFNRKVPFQDVAKSGLKFGDEGVLVRRLI